MEGPDSTSHKSEFSIRRSGRPFSKDYRIYFERTHDKTPVSPFHDIPLYHDKKKGILNMVVEVPRWTNAKFEISRDESLNPIHQDILDHKPRFVKNVFPYKGYLWNYGALPQTWENPHHTTPETHTKGDNDPLDACEIGRAVSSPGEVKRVKVLGILALIDKGETDWKVLVIDVKDPLAEKVNDIEDVDEYFPGLLDASRDWWRVYRVPDGERGNEFGFGGRWLDKKHAEKVIGECEDAWKRLITGKVKRGDISLDNTTLKDTPGKMDPDKVHLPPDEVKSPAPVEQDLEEWYYVDRKALDATEASLEGSNLRIGLNMRW